MIARQQHTAATVGRLDRFLLDTYPWLDRPTVLALIAQGQILVNDRPAKKGARLQPGVIITCRDIPEADDLRAAPNPDLPLVILYEDDSLLALDKPAGQPTHPLHYAETGTLANALIARHPHLATIGPTPLFPAILHRLDTQTSGILLAAKTSAAYTALREQFRALAIQKRYTALVHGRVTAPGRLDAPLTHHTRTPCKMRLATERDAATRKETFPATTAWTPLQTGLDTTLLDVAIHTGVTHQIRCHLAASGHPIVGDTLYGSPPPAPPRHWLHDGHVTFTHPVTQAILELAAPLPTDWPLVT